MPSRLMQQSSGIWIPADGTYDSTTQPDRANLSMLLNVTQDDNDQVRVLFASALYAPLDMPSIPSGSALQRGIGSQIVLDVMRLDVTSDTPGQMRTGIVGAGVIGR